MVWKVGMPNLGHTMETGTVSEWLIHPGDAVKKGDTIALVESDKVTVEIESPSDGVLLKILTDAEIAVPPGHVLALVGDADEAIDPDDDANTASATGGEVDDDDASAMPSRQPSPGPSTEKTRPSKSGAAGARKRRVATPLAKRLCVQNDLDPLKINGSGPKGVVVKSDVLRTLEGPAKPAGPAGKGRAVPLKGMRASISRRMTKAWREIPMVTLTASADISDLLANADYLRAEAGINATVMAAVAKTLEHHDKLNAWLIDDTIHLADSIDLGFAVALDEGLVTPVVRRANQRSPANIAQEVRRLAEQARAGQLETADLFDATFTVSNLGGFDVEMFTPIINPPQVAILGVGAVRQVPVPSQKGIVFRDTLTLSLVFDHRALDGATAARFLRDLKATLADASALFSDDESMEA